MDIIKEINNCYLSISQDNDFTAEYKYLQEQMTNLDLRYQRESIPWNFKPYFITEKQFQKFGRVTEVLISALEKLSAAYFRNDEINSLLPVKGDIQNYLHINHGYTGNNIVVRGDTLYNPANDSLYFIEFNCGDPSGLAAHDLSARITDLFPVMKILSNRFNLLSNDIMDSFYKMLLTKYKEYCKNSGRQEHKDPLIAVVCANNSCIRFDINEVIDFLQEKGARVQYADPRDFNYDGKILRLKSNEVHIVYRDNEKDFFRTESSGKWYSEIRNKVLSLTKAACLKNNLVNRVLKRGYLGHAEDILKAYKDGNICLINPFSSYITAKKSVLAILQDKHFCSLFTDEELDVIKKHIPWTRQLKQQQTDYCNGPVNLVDFIKANRQKFIIKPNDAFGGNGVMLGPETNQVDWENTIDTVIKSKADYVVQEYINIPSENFPRYIDGRLQGFIPKYFNLNLWAFDGKFAGGFVRTSETKIINVAKGASYAPIYQVSYKN